MSTHNIGGYTEASGLSNCDVNRVRRRIGMEANDIRVLAGIAGQVREPGGM